MSRALSASTLDGESFWSALAAGALDACLVYLRQEAGAGAGDAERDCRLAEALLHQRRCDDAIECCQRAFPLATGNASMLRICAWVFSNGQCHDEAASAYRRLIELCPDWTDGHRHLSGSLAAAGRIDEAIAHAAAACELAPHNAEFALHAGSLLLAARRHDEAAH